MSRSEEFESGYRGQHQPASYGALHEADKAYPDVYEHPEYYSSGESHETEAHRSMLLNRGKPDRMTWIHRAMPKESEGGINPGDWVSMSKSYAKEHGESALNGNYKVSSRRVPAKEVHLTGDYLPEAGWVPS